jgi:hypothetical protein
MKNECKRCGYEWLGRIDNPLSCPNCKVRGWDISYPAKCKICKRIFNFLALHHIDGNRKNNHKKNRIHICVDCHSVIHNKLNIKSKTRKGIIRHSRTRKYLNDNEIKKILVYYKSKWLERNKNGE